MFLEVEAKFSDIFGKAMKAGWQRAPLATLDLISYIPRVQIFLVFPHTVYLKTTVT